MKPIWIAPAAALFFAALLAAESPHMSALTLLSLIGAAAAGAAIAWRPVAVTSAKSSESPKANESQHELPAQWQSILQGLDMGAWELDVASGQAHWLNDWCTRMDIEECRRSHLESWARRIHPQDLAIVHAANDECIAGRRDFYDCEYRVLTTWGDWRWLHMRARCTQRGSDGRALRMAGICLDIDQIKRADIAIRATASSPRTQLRSLAALGFKLRTQANTLLGMLQLLRCNTQDATQHDQLETAERAGEGLQQLLQDVVDYANLESGQTRLRRRALNPRQIVENVVRLNTGAGLGKSLALRAAIDSAVPEQIIGDEARLHQILDNLIRNAVRYTPRGEIQVSMHVRDEHSSAKQLCLVVEDSGIGLPGHRVTSFFEPFDLLDTTSADRPGGSGLGLAICRDLVRQMEGSIHVESHPNCGTRVWVVLPLELPSAEATLLDTRTISSDSRDPADPRDNVAPLHGNVLLVEDDFVNREVAAAMLRHLGVDYDTAENGEVALERMRHGEYDAVLMDCAMPLLDGFEATRRIRSLEKELGRTRIPVIAVTANALRGDRDNCLASGMDDFIPKPIPLRDLSVKLEHWISESRKTRRSTQPDSLAGRPAGYREVPATQR